MRKVIDAQKRLDELSTARIVEQAAEAVHKLQKNGQPLHTVAPEAILVTASGISLELPATPNTDYISPEKREGKAGDRRSDVYSLGAVLWSALTHEEFPGEYLATTEFNANIPAELDAICQKALAKDPADRFHSAKVMAAEIGSVLDDAGYPEDNDQIATYLREAFAPPTKPSGADLAAKLAAAPAGSNPAISGPAPAIVNESKSSKHALNQTILGMAPIRESSSTPSANDTIVPLTKEVVPLTKEKVVELIQPKAEAASPSKDAKADKKTDKKKGDKAEEKKPERSNPSSLSPTAFSKSPAEASASSAGIAVSPSTPWGAPSATSAGLVATPAALDAKAPGVATPVATKGSPIEAKAPAPVETKGSPIETKAAAPAPAAPAAPVVPVTPSAVAAAAQPALLTADPMRTLPFGSNAISAADIAAAAAAQTAVEKAEAELAKAEPKPTISNAETVATPALVPTTPKEDLKKTADGYASSDVLMTIREQKPLGAQVGEAIAPAANIAGLPSIPPGATIPPAASDDFATKDNAKKYPDGPPEMPAPVAAATAPMRPSAPKLPEAAAAVSLQMPRKRSETGGDLLDKWASSTDSHAAIDDGIDEVELDNKKQRKRLFMAIGGALGVILLVTIVAFAFGGGGDKKKKPEVDEAALANAPSRTAPEPEPAAKAADSPPAPTEPGAGVDPAPTEPTPTEPTEPAVGSGSSDEAAIKAAEEAKAAEAAKAAEDAKAAEAAKIEADKQAKADAEAKAAADKQAKADAEAKAAADKQAKIEADKLAKADAASKAEADRLAKAEAAKKAAADKQAKLDADKQSKADAAAKAEEARLAKAEAAKSKAEEARLAKAEAARVAKEKADAAKAAKAEAAAKAKAEAAANPKPKTEPKVTAKEPKKEPKKKDKRVAQADVAPIDPYAEQPSSKKADPAAAYKTGFQQYVRGDTSGALTTFKDSLAANPGYPPTYRGLGLVYEKMGNKPQAKRAFSRYLQLSPSAGDAEQIRDRMARL